MPQKHTIMVACTEPESGSHMLHCNVQATAQEVLDGKHHDMAIAQAISGGYDGPFVCFDEDRHDRIALITQALKSPTPFSLIDHDDEASQGEGVRVFAGPLVCS